MSAGASAREPLGGAALARALFAPRSIALVGASADPGKYSSLPQRYLARHGYRGMVYPINPTRHEVLGVRAYPSARSIGAPVDAAFVLLPTARVEAAIADCAAAGVGVATILADGFAESGEDGRRAEARLVAIAREAGLRLVGPNSLGVLHLAHGVAISANEVLSLDAVPHGRIGLVSQSGSIMGALLSRGHARGIGFSKLVSTGNEADLGLAELAGLLVEDDATDCVLLFIETIRDAPALAAVVERAHARGKPVVAYRLGRSRLGRSLAQSHTGAIAGSAAAIESFLRDIGALVIDRFDTLLEIAPLVIGRRPQPRRRATVVTTTGGGGALAVDALAAHGIELVPPDDASVAALAERGIAIEAKPLVDLTLAGANAATYGAVLDALDASANSDFVVAVGGSSAQFRPERVVAPILARQRGAPRKPLALFLTPAAEASERALLESGVAVFRSPEALGDAVDSLARWRSPRPPVASTAAVDQAAALVRGVGRASLDASEAARVFASLGVTTVGETLLPPAPAGWPGATLASLPFPVVAKVLSPDIAHRTESGGITLGVDSPDALREACESMLASVRRAHPGARVTAIQVQPFVRGALAEVLVGYTRDPSTGPMVTLAAGGVLAELHGDFSMRPAPVDAATARAMIAEVRSLAALAGHRNLPRGDLEALARAVAAVSQLAFLDAHPASRVLEAEINPLVVLADGVLALDALLRCAPR